MVAFPNPPSLDVYAYGQPADEVGDIADAARVAGVEPGTIRVWVSRRKVEPLVRSREAGDLYHLPTIARAAQTRAAHRPPDPAANSRGHRRQPTT